MNKADFQTQLSSILDILTKRAMAEIGRLFEENSLLLSVQVSRFTEENESLKQRCRFLENQLKGARKTGEKNRTRSLRLSYSGTEQQPMIEGVFGKEWCRDLWEQEESGSGEQQDQSADLDCSDLTGEVEIGRLNQPGTVNKKVMPISFLEEVVVVNSGEMVKTEDSRCEEDGSRRLTGPGISADGRHIDRSSGCYTTYTIPSDEPKAEGGSLEGMISAQGADLTIYHKAQKKKPECFICGKSLESTYHLQRHMRIHSGEKPYECGVCGKRFAEKTYLTVHERTHSGEKPFVCKECGKSFAQKCSLNVHFRSHTGLKPYKCTKCGNGYGYQFRLNAHMIKCKVKKTRMTLPTPALNCI